MKIVQIIPSLKKGGAERLVLDICNEMQNRKGVEVHLVTYDQTNDYKFLTANINHHVCKAKVMPSITGRAFVNTKEYKAKIEEIDPDIIHSHLFEAEMTSRWDCTTKPIYFTHFHSNIKQLTKFTLSTLFTKKKITYFYERLTILKKYKRIRNYFVCISNETFSFARKVLPSRFKSQIFLQPNAINVQRFYRDGIKATPNKQKGIKLVTVGSLVDKKNQIFLLEVVEKLKERKINIKLDILGDGPKKQAIRDKIIELGLEDSVTLHGNVENVEDFLCASDFYVHSALSEPFGLVFIEAYACGLPVVSFDGRGNRDIVLNGKNGYLIEDLDPKIFADKIEGLIEDNSAYRSMSDYAKEFALKYDIVSYVDHLLALYKKSLNKKSIL